MASELFDLTGKVAVVTGGNTGIGLGMVKALFANGANVCIWGTDAGRNQQAVKMLGPSRGRLLAIECDVGNELDVEAAFDEVAGTLGRVDAVFANAGIDGLVPSVLELSGDEWRRVHRVNLDGAFYTLRAGARHMVAQGGGGSLVATSSIGALGGRPGREHYSASKGALFSLIRGLATELGRHGIRANVVVPGAVETEMAARAPDIAKIRERVAARVPLGRHARPEEFGGIAVYLASDASSYHTGDVIVVDGGFTAA